MYEAYWKLKERPFVNTPDPKYLYYSREHEEGLSRLLYAVQANMGGCLLTGVFGCGKTLLTQALIENLNKSGGYKIALITNPFLSHIELLRMIAYELGAANLPDKKSDILTDFLVETIEKILHNNNDDGKHTVVIIDEAHIIEDKLIFEELRLLLNYQLKDKFLVTLILSGQPELKKSVDGIKQLSQRIPLKYHLDRFDFGETKNYIAHRLAVAGSREPLFGEEVLKMIYESSGGIPRRINNICDMSLLLGFSKGLLLITEDVVTEVIKDLEE
ncbi:MAG: AAA family ATPase [Candidatus Omnitrophica bacterium]|nr:AAA family ATPase [Candidatus Omnitrophota bacterium]